MTSNIGSRQLKDFGQGVGFATAAKTDGADDHTKGVIEKSLKKAFAPEFLNRIDDVVLFNSLKREDIHKIIDIELASLVKRIEGLGYFIKLTTKAKDYIADKGYDEAFGARPLKRAIQKYIEDPMAEEIINNKLHEGDTISLDFDKKTDDIKIGIVKGDKKEEKEVEDGDEKTKK